MKQSVHVTCQMMMMMISEIPTQTEQLLNELLDSVLRVDVDEY